MYATNEVRMSDMTFIDNDLGVYLSTAGERSSAKSSLHDTEIYGEAVENEDCPSMQECHCTTKYGLMLFTNNAGAKDLHPTMPSALPIHKIKSNGVWASSAEVKNVSFHNFNGVTKCGRKQYTMMRNKFAADYIPLHKFSNILFKNVDDSSVAFIEDPNPKWANKSDCDTFPCTAPSNVVLHFTGTQYSGSI